MKQTRLLMGMPITVEIIDSTVRTQDVDDVFGYFRYIDEKFSIYKTTSEITGINNGEIVAADYSPDMKTVLALSEKTKQQTNGYFDIVNQQGVIDPSGLVKGWAINNAAEILNQRGFGHYYIEAGGDIQVRGGNSEGAKWRVGIQNPSKPLGQIIKVIYVGTEGVATSGTSMRGQHIYNPKEKQKQIADIISLTVIGPNIYEADRFATAAFAMGFAGINFIEQLPGFEGYVVDKNGIATMTSKFEDYTRDYV